MEEAAWQFVSKQGSESAVVGCGGFSPADDGPTTSLIIEYSDVFWAVADDGSFGIFTFQDCDCKAAFSGIARGISSPIGHSGDANVEKGSAFKSSD
ncbi:hypothetical protein B879_04090 [Cecembia lonarensis LW9]|uniref:Uncharacterized protein n=1 Tax=Cecembia lonarensis (strain CCUG 58316 / KCTC 22772 / LW9) TaxID=1225176 RepID=K1KT36_CECL9|nr:hypothetical protein B879_04090 [Cecembia lonarensis LW9]